MVWLLIQDQHRGTRLTICRQRLQLAAPGRRSSVLAACAPAPRAVPVAVAVVCAHVVIHQQHVSTATIAVAPGAGLACAQRLLQAAQQAVLQEVVNVSLLRDAQHHAVERAVNLPAGHREGAGRHALQMRWLQAGDHGIERMVEKVAVVEVQLVLCVHQHRPHQGFRSDVLVRRDERRRWRTCCHICLRGLITAVALVEVLAGGYCLSSCGSAACCTRVLFLTLQRRRLSTQHHVVVLGGAGHHSQRIHRRRGR
mmetsp:Transcript_40287/g.120152  ORF Transcript_40287/g.120152 Transcript_40287/m.120152 type:complete len:254 (-) Transcript_40287:142-903(-)